MTPDALVELLTVALPMVGTPAGQVADDCPVIPVAEAIQLVRLARHGGVTVDGENITFDFSVMRGH